MRIVVSSSLIVSITPSSSREGLLALFPCSSMGSIPQAIVFYELLKHEPFLQGLSSSWTAPLWVLSVGCIPVGTNCSSAGCPSHKSFQQICSTVGSHLHMSCQKPASAWASHGVPASFGHLHLLWHRVLHGLQVHICSSVDLHRLQGDKHASPCPSPWAAGESWL